MYQPVRWIVRLGNERIKMNGKDKAYWLSDKIPAYGDYAVEAAILLKSQADEIESLKLFITECRDEILYPLSHQESELGRMAEILGSQTYAILTPNVNSTHPKIVRIKMNQEKQRELAIECGFAHTPEALYCTVVELAAYTAVVEARERERCISKCEYVRNILLDKDMAASDVALLVAAADDCITAIIAY